MPSDQLDMVSLKTISIDDRQAGGHWPIAIPHRCRIDVLPDDRCVHAEGTWWGLTKMGALTLRSHIVASCASIEHVATYSRAIP